MQDTIKHPKDTAPHYSRSNPISRYETYLEEDPDNVVLLTTLGDLYHQAGQLHNAIECFKQCLKLDDKNIVARICLSKTLISAHRFHLAERVLRELINEGSSTSLIQFDLGLTLYYQQRWSEASDAFKRAGESDPNNMAYMVYCLHHQHNFGKALALAKKWITNNPSVENNGYLSLLEMDHGSLVVAQKRALNVVKSDPHNVSANLVLGLSFLEKKKPLKAKNFFSMAAQRDAKHPRVMFYLALVDIHQSHCDDAAEKLSSIKNNIAKTLTATVMGWCKLHNYNSNEAINYFKAAIEADKGNDLAYCGLSLACFFTKQHSKSRKWVTKARGISAQSPIVTIIDQLLSDTDNNQKTPASSIEELFSEKNRDIKEMINEQIARFTISRTKGMSDRRPKQVKQHKISDLLLLANQTQESTTINSVTPITCLLYTSPSPRDRG